MPQTKNSRLPRTIGTLAATTLCLWVSLAAKSTLAQPIAAPDGTGTVVTVDGNQFNISGGTLSGDGTHLFQGFQEFGLDANQIANFLATPQVQNILGRVVSGNPSVISGLIQVTGSNANLYLMNPAGIVFGPGASLNVSGDFFATTATGIGFGNGNWFNAFGSNDYQTLVGTPSQFAFDFDNPAAVVNAGNLAVGEGQNLTLLGGAIVNTGTLSAREGSVTLTAIPGTSLVRISQPGSLLSLEIEPPRNAGGHLQGFTALDLPELLTRTGVETGLTVNPDNTIALSSSGTTIPHAAGTTVVAGTVDVYSATGLGGEVNALGDRVGLFRANINASGPQGGGLIRIGGDLQGKGEIPNSDRLYVDGESAIAADAIPPNPPYQGGSGDGGRVILWADGTTFFGGEITARGGSGGGDGGFVEVSGAQVLDYQGTVDTTAPQGKVGTLLLDPTNIIVVAAGADTATLDDVNELIDPDLSVGGTRLDVTAINTAMANVILQATNDITFDTAVNIGNAGVGLTAQAGNDININANITANGGNLTFSADDDNNGTGSLNVTNATIATNGGNVTATGRGGLVPIHGITLNGSTIDAGGGDVTLNGTGRGGINFSYGVNLENNSAVTTTGTGAIALTGTGGNGGNNNYGIRIDNSRVQATDGNIAVAGTGSGTGESNHGIILFNGGTVESVGTGAIALTGTGSAGTQFNDGVHINGVNSQVRSQNGTIAVTGTGGAGMNVNRGVLVEGNGAISSVNGNIRLEGTGQGTGSANHGVNIAINGTVETTGTGTVTLQGTSSGNEFNHGIALDNNGSVRSQNGDITATGTGSAGTNTNRGISIENNSAIASTNGNINLVGTSQSTGVGNHGVNVAGSGTVETTGTGTVTLQGTGSGTGENNHGVNLDSNGEIVSTGTGAISITGTSSGNQFNHGISIRNNANVRSQSGNITATGTGSAGVDENRGILVEEGGAIASVDGNIRLEGTGQGTGFGNHGVNIAMNGTVESTGNGTVTLQGMGSAGASFNHGISVNDDTRITATNGNLTLNGTGANVGFDNHGVNMTNSSALETRGTGTLDITGMSGNNATGILSTDGTLNTTGSDIRLSGNSIRFTGTISSLGGNIEILAPGGSIEVGQVSSESPSNNGGNIRLNGQDIQTGNINANGSQVAGNIEIASTGTINTVNAIVSAIGGTNGGNITMSALGDISTAVLSIFNSGFNGSSGNISLTSTNGNIDTTAGDLSSASAKGVGGNIDLSAAFNLAIASVTAQSFTNTGGRINLNAGTQIAAGGEITTNNNDITFNAPVALTGDTTVRSAETGNVTFASTIDGARNLTLDAGTGMLGLGGDLGSTTPLNNVAIENDPVVPTTGFKIAATGSITTGDITSPGGITLTSEEGAIAAGLLNTAANADAGPILLDARGDILVKFINAQSLQNGTGGTVEIATRRFFRATQTFRDRNGLDASISVAGEEGGTVTIRHQGGGLIPFIVGDSDLNGTAGAITRGNAAPEQTIAPQQTFFPTHKQDRDRLQIIAVEPAAFIPPPTPVSPSLPSPTLAPDPKPNPNPLIQLAFFLGDLLGAETQITQQPTGDYKFVWQINNGISETPDPQTVLSLQVQNRNRSVHVETTPFVGRVNYIPDTVLQIETAPLTPLKSIEQLDLAQDPEDLVADIDQVFEEQFEEYLGENITDRQVTAQSIRDTLKTIEQDTGTQAAVIYALPYLNELQLVLVRPDGPPLVKTVRNATRRQLKNQLYALQNALFSPTTPSYLEPAQQLYNWLIAPLASELEQLGIDTLIFATAAELNAFPLAILHDGDRFLVEKYSLGSIPSFSLTDTRYHPLQQSSILAMGASEFPHSGHQPLPAVSVELNAIAPPGQSFLNQDFTLNNLKNQRHRNPFDIIHLATHASFQPLNSDSAYIQFWDEKIGLTGLRNVEWYAGRPVQLLVLSACETAIGNPRTEMGFAGLAVQAGVKSALASLWRINDLATLPLMTEFYAQLGREEVKIKAEALRQAQLSLLRGRVRVELGQLRGADTAISLPSELSSGQGTDFSHPYYWAGFTIVGSPW